MKEYKPEFIRNVAFAGHGGSGKTSLAELLLFTAGEVNRIGNISEGNTISDYTQNEIDRQFSISLSLLHAEWKNTKINLLDTPGYSDFVGEVKAGLRVADTALLTVKSVEGVEVGTELSYDFMKELELSTAVIINKIDSERSDFENVVSQLKERISSDATVITFPVNEGLNVDSVIDVLAMKKFTYGEAGSKKLTEGDIPEDLKGKAEELRTELIEKIAESDEELMNNYFENGELSEDELRKGISSAMSAGSFIPVFATSALKGIGITNVLNFIASYFPSPSDRPAAKALLKSKESEVEVACDVNGEPVLFIFKIISEQHVGELSLFRVYSGKAEPGLDLWNVNREKTERLSQLYMLNGRNRKEMDSIIAGDIGAVVKLKDSHTNNTLATKNYDVEIAPINFPDSIIRGAIIPKAKGDEDKIATCLNTVHEEDPSFSVKYDPEIAQTIIAGQGELQLALAVNRLKERYNVEVDLVKPKTPYRETVRGRCDSVEYKHKKQSGGRGQFGHVYFKMEPLPRGTGFEFVDAIVGGVVPGRFIPAVEKGINEIMTRGVISGCQVVDVKVTLFDGSYHSVDSDEMSFKLASTQAFKKGFLAADPILLEPIYLVEIKIPEEFMGDVMGDISSRRGKIQGMDSDGHFQVLKAMIPLDELYKYSSTLRSLTQGRGAYTREFSHYEQVPKEVETKIIEAYQKSKEED